MTPERMADVLTTCALLLNSKPTEGQDVGDAVVESVKRLTGWRSHRSPDIADWYCAVCGVRVEEGIHQCGTRHS
jgi:hypothetical protein